MKKIVVIGSLNIDLVSHVSHLPNPGETITSERFHIIPGGKGANQAVAAAKLGADVTMVGKVGIDEYGPLLVNNLVKSGVKVDYVKNEDKSGRAFITVDHEGENNIVLVSGANNKIKRSDIDEVVHVIMQADIVLMQLEIPIDVVEYTLKIAKKFNKQVILNPAPAQKLTNEMLSTVHTLIPNENELQLLSGMPTSTLQEIAEAAVYIKSSGVTQVVVTMGSKGAYVVTDTEQVHIPAEKVVAVDTTGAGDAFIASFTVGIVSGISCIESAQLANKVAAIAVTTEGSQPPLPLLEKVANHTQ